MPALCLIQIKRSETMKNNSVTDAAVQNVCSGYNKVRKEGLTLSMRCSFLGKSALQ